MATAGQIAAVISGRRSETMHPAAGAPVSRTGTVTSGSFTLPEEAAMTVASAWR